MHNDSRVRKIKKNVGHFVLFSAVVAVTLLFLCNPEGGNDIKSFAAMIGNFNVVKGVAIQYTGAGGDIVFPDEIGGIGEDLFNGNKKITGVTIPDGTLYVGVGAFKDCSNLKYVLFPNSTYYIGDSAFSGCTSITDVVLPRNLRKITASLFEGCTSLSSVTINSDISSIDDKAFYGCTALKSLTIPASVESISSTAFKNSGIKEIYGYKDSVAESTARKLGLKFNDLGVYYGSEQDAAAGINDFVINEGVLVKYTGTAPKVSVPAGVKKIGSEAFKKCYGLTDVILPEGLTEVGTEAFAYCYSLENVTLPKSLSIVGERAFYFCTMFEEVNIPDAVTEIRPEAFYNCTELSEVVMGVGVKTVGYGAFANCNRLSDVRLSENLALIDKEAFYNCPVLQKIELPSALVYIGEGAFRESGITQINIPGSLLRVTERAFENCLSLKKVTTDIGVGEIAKEAFAGCRSLEAVMLAKTVTLVEDDAFKNAGKKLSIYGTSGSYAEAYAAKNKYVFVPINEYVEETVISGNTYVAYNGNDEIVVIGNNITQIASGAFSGCTSIKTIVIPDSVTDIEPYAFYNCTSLEKVSMGKKVVSIGDYAFYGCSSLKSISLPNSVEWIGTYAFAMCDRLTTINIPPRLTKLSDGLFSFCVSLDNVTIPSTVTTIGEAAFFSCDSLKAIKLPTGVKEIGNIAFYWCVSLTEVEIPEGVKKLPSQLFLECKKLTTVTIPASVTYIEETAFKNSGLTTIKGYRGSAAEKFANANGYKFVALKAATPTPIKPAATDKPTPTPTIVKPVASPTPVPGSGALGVDTSKGRSIKNIRIDEYLAEELRTDIIQAKAAGIGISDTDTLVILKGLMDVFSDKLPGSSIDDMFLMDISLINEYGHVVSDFDWCEITLPLSDEMRQYAENIRPVTLDSDGNLEPLRFELVIIDGRECISFITYHFSNFAFVNDRHHNIPVYVPDEEIEDYVPQTGEETVYDEEIKRRDLVSMAVCVILGVLFWLAKKNLLNKN